MDRFKIVIEGYAYAESDHYVASPSTTVVESKGKVVLVDPGTDPKLKKKLNESGYKLEDINIIYLTHYHPDHFLNIRLFPEHKIYDGETIWEDNKEFEMEENIPGTNIEIIPTPGHSPEHTSLLINTEKGRVCIAQDVFWWEDGKQNNESEKILIELEDPFASDVDELKKSRKKVLEIADWIIPGHGKIFKNPTR